ncbi:MAG: hypothetical protein ABIQ05_03845 [Candidatus Limnocylindria bacterium]
MRNHRILAPILTTALILSACSTVGSQSPGQSIPASASIPADSGSPAPLPGGRLVWWGSPSGSRELAVFSANPDGSDEEILLAFDAQGSRWSPDGTKLSVVVESPQGLVFIGMVNPDGSDYVRFDSPDPTLGLGCFAWSPDGLRLACEGWDDTDPTRNGIYTVRASDGGDLIRVTTSPDGGHDIPGDYSPDGRQIVFWREQGNGLMLVNVDGSGERALTDRNLGGGSWSPDGRTILADEDGSLWNVPIDGSGPSQIIIEDARDGSAFGGSWSPDGGWIVFSLKVGQGNADIYIMRKDGTDLRQITDTPLDEEYADWG